MKTLNCHVKDLSRAFECIIEDAKNAFPDLEAEFQRDLIRLQAAVKARGIRVFLVDLPALAKHLDRCLAEGTYSRSGLPLSKGTSRRAKTPKFLRGIHLRVFDDSGCLAKECSPLAVSFYRQLLLFAKKYRIDCPSDVVEHAVQNFIEQDRLRPKPSRFWFSQDQWDSTARPCITTLSTQPGDSSLLRIFAVVAKIISNSLGSYDPQEWRFRHGPGAIAEQTGRVDKYKWSTWSRSLESVYPFADYGFHSHSSWADYVSRVSVSGDQTPSRLVAVPKTFSGPRLIAAEPGSGMWCQQNLLDYFACNIERSWIGGFITLRDQSDNRRLALIGSRDNSVATVDLSAASDTVTCQTVEYVFGDNISLMHALRAVRTPIVSQRLTQKVSEIHMLRSFSTMGNAVTFPVESLVFLCVAIAACLRAEEKSPSMNAITALIGKVKVFGDDIVIPTSSREPFLRLCELLQFDVNPAKTFWSGSFRESCGCDAFRGHDVTPVYVRQTFDGTAVSLSSAVMTRNNFYKKYLLACSSWLESTLPPGIPEVAYDNGSFGYTVRRAPDVLGIVRWNPNLQRKEVRCLAVKAKANRSRTDGHSALLQYFTEKPAPTYKWEAGYVRDTNEVIRWSWTPVSSLGCSASDDRPLL